MRESNPYPGIQVRDEVTLRNYFYTYFRDFQYIGTQMEFAKFCVSLMESGFPKQSALDSLLNDIKMTDKKERMFEEEYGADLQDYREELTDEMFN